MAAEVCKRCASVFLTTGGKPICGSCCVDAECDPPCEDCPWKGPNSPLRASKEET